MKTYECVGTLTLQGTVKATVEAESETEASKKFEETLGKISETGEDNLRSMLADGNGMTIQYAGTTFEVDFVGES